MTLVYLLGIHYKYSIPIPTYLSDCSADRYGLRELNQLNGHVLYDTAIIILIIFHVFFIWFLVANRYSGKFHHRYLFVRIRLPILTCILL